MVSLMLPRLSRSIGTPRTNGYIVQNEALLKVATALGRIRTAMGDWREMRGNKKPSADRLSPWTVERALNFCGSFAFRR
jgi:hypothetical protein